MLDHIFIAVTDLARSIVFYEEALAPLGISHVLDYDGKDGPPGHPDLKGFGHDGLIFFWLRAGEADQRALHVGFVAKSKAEVPLPPMGAPPCGRRFCFLRDLCG